MSAIRCRMWPVSPSPTQPARRSADHHLPRAKRQHRVKRYTLGGIDDLTTVADDVSGPRLAVRAPLAWAFLIRRLAVSGARL